MIVPGGNVRDNLEFPKGEGEFPELMSLLINSDGGIHLVFLGSDHPYNLWNIKSVQVAGGAESNINQQVDLHSGVDRINKVVG